MLTLDVDKRITIDECLEHSWTTQQPISVTNGTDNLTDALLGLDFSKRKPMREGTLLSSISDVKVETPTESGTPPVKVFDKNAGPHFIANRNRLLLRRMGRRVRRGMFFRKYGILMGLASSLLASSIPVRCDRAYLKRCWTVVTRYGRPQDLERRVLKRLPIYVRHCQRFGARFCGFWVT